MTLKELVEQYNMPKAWLAELCGFSRTQVSNWVSQPDKYPVPEAKKIVIEEKLRELGNVLVKIELQ